MLNWRVVLLLARCCFDNTDPPDSDQDSSQEPCEKKIKSSSSQVKTNVPSRANREILEIEEALADAEIG